MVPKSLQFIKNKLGLACVLRLFRTFVTLKMISIFVIILPVSVANGGSTILP